MTDLPKTRGAKTRGEDEVLIQRVIEKIFISEEFLDKMMTKISEAVSKSIESIVKVYDEKVELIDNKIMNMKKIIDNQEQFSRRNNIRIYGIPEDRGENVQTKVSELVEQKLGIKLSVDDFDFCYRLRSKEGTNRPIMVRFCRNYIRQEVYKNKSKLKGTKVVVKEDLTRTRIEVYKKAGEKFGPKNVWSSEGNVFCKVSDKFYKLATLKDLEKVKL